MDQVVDPPVDLVALTRALIDIDSTTGREHGAGEWLAGRLARYDGILMPGGADLAAMARAHCPTAPVSA